MGGKIIYLNNAMQTPVLFDFTNKQLPDNQQVIPYSTKLSLANTQARHLFARTLKIPSWQILFLNSLFETLMLIKRILGRENIKKYYFFEFETPSVKLFLKEAGFEEIPVNHQNLPEKDNSAFFVSHTNPLTGEIRDFKNLQKLIKKHNNIFIAELSHSLGKIELNFEKLGFDIALLQSGLFYAPAGITAVLDLKNILQISDFQLFEPQNKLPFSFAKGLEYNFNKKYYVKLKSLNEHCARLLSEHPRIQILREGDKKYNPFILAFRITGLKNPFYFYLNLLYRDVILNYSAENQTFIASFSLSTTPFDIEECAKTLSTL